MPVTLGGLGMRRHHLTCMATAGTVGSWVNAGYTSFLEIHPKHLAELHYLIVGLNTVITKLPVKSWVNRRKQCITGMGDYFTSVERCEGWRNEPMNRIPYQRFISSPLQIAYLMIRAANVSDLLFISPLTLIAFGFPKDSLWQNWLFCPQQV